MSYSCRQCGQQLVESQRQTESFDGNLESPWICKTPEHNVVNVCSCCGANLKDSAAPCCQRPPLNKN